MRAIERLAETRRLLVASDFDGVLAPIVDDPEGVVPIARAFDALTDLAALPETHVAVVSGRERAWLARRVPNSNLFALAGSHGAELDERDSADVASGALDKLGRALDDIAAEFPGFHLERKPMSVAAHLRRVDPADKPAAAAATDALVGPWRGKVIRGKEIVEFTLARATKGDAITTLRSRVGASAVFYAGDDVTDEDVFAVLDEVDVGVKVGPGDTRAQYRVSGPDDVVEVLEALARERRVRLGP
jgi:trehalose 6-phosphate phosphatase